MVDTSNRAELKNCISNAQDVIEQIKSKVGRLDNKDGEDLRRLAAEADILLKEADERCNQLL